MFKNNLREKGAKNVSHSVTALVGLSDGNPKYTNSYHIGKVSQCVQSINCVIERERERERGTKKCHIL